MAFMRSSVRSRSGPHIKRLAKIYFCPKAASILAPSIFEFSGLIPDSLYTVMSLRQRDLDPGGPTRPGPLGVPNACVADEHGKGCYRAVLPNPFPSAGSHHANRIVNVVVLWMSYQMSRGGAIGWFGLGGDIHAQLKLPSPSFSEFETIS